MDPSFLRQTGVSGSYGCLHSVQACEPYTGSSDHPSSHPAKIHGQSLHSPGSCNVLSEVSSEHRSSNSAHCHSSSELEDVQKMFAEICDPEDEDGLFPYMSFLDRLTGKA